MKAKKKKHNNQCNEHSHSHSQSYSYKGQNGNQRKQQQNQFPSVQVQDKNLPSSQEKTNTNTNANNIQSHKMFFEKVIQTCSKQIKLIQLSDFSEKNKTQLKKQKKLNVDLLVKRYQELTLARPKVNRISTTTDFILKQIGLQDAKQVASILTALIHSRQEQILQSRESQKLSEKVEVEVEVQKINEKQTFENNYVIHIIWQCDDSDRFQNSQFYDNYNVFIKKFNKETQFKNLQQFREQYKTYVLDRHMKILQKIKSAKSIMLPNYHHIKKFINPKLIQIQMQRGLLFPKLVQNYRHDCPYQLQLQGYSLFFSLLDEKIRLKFMKQIAQNLQLLKGLGICHYDIRIKNIIYSIKDNRFKLIDFDSSKHFDIRSEIFRPNLSQDENETFLQKFLTQSFMEMLKLKKQDNSINANANVNTNFSYIELFNLRLIQQVSNLQKQNQNIIKEGEQQKIDTKQNKNNSYTQQQTLLQQNEKNERYEKQAKLTQYNLIIHKNNQILDIKQNSFKILHMIQKFKHWQKLKVLYFFKQDKKLFSAMMIKLLYEMTKFKVQNSPIYLYFQTIVKQNCYYENTIRNQFIGFFEKIKSITEQFFLIFNQFSLIQFSIQSKSQMIKSQNNQNNQNNKGKNKEVTEKEPQKSFNDNQNSLILHVEKPQFDQDQNDLNEFLKNIIINNQDKRQKKHSVKSKSQLEQMEQILAKIQNQNQTANQNQHQHQHYQNQHLDYFLQQQILQEALKFEKKTFGQQHPQYQQTLNKFQMNFVKNPIYYKAKSYFQKAIQKKKLVLGQDQMKYAKYLNNLAAVSQKIGEFDKAQEYYLKCLKIVKKQQGKNTYQYCLALNNIAYLYLNKNQFKLSLQHFSQSLKIIRKVQGPNCVDEANSLNGIGLVYHEKGDLEKAHKYYLKSKNILQYHCQQNSSEYSSILNNIGHIYQLKSKYDIALQYYQKSLQIRKDVLGCFHPQYAESLNNIGVIYYNKSRFNLALQYHLRSLKTKLAIFGSGCIQSTYSYFNIGMVYLEIGFISHALKLFQKCYFISNQKLGQNNINCAQYLYNIGLAYDQKQDLVNALQYYSKSLQINKNLLGQNSVEYGKSLGGIGSIYQKKEDFDKALQCYIKAAQIIQKSVGQYNSYYAICLNNMGSIYDQKKYYDQAQWCYQKSLGIRKKIFGQNHGKYAESLNNLGTLFCKKQNLEKAYDFLNKSLKIKQCVFGQNHPRCKNIQKNIAFVKVQLEKRTATQGSSILTDKRKIIN